MMPRVTPARMAVLRLMSRDGGLSVRELGAKLKLSPNGIHTHLRAAREDGLAEYSGRFYGWHLTDEGCRIVEALREWL